MKPSQVNPGDMLCLEKDKQGFIHIKLYRNGASGIDTVTITRYPRIPTLNDISRNIVFFQERYAPLLQQAGIISQYFQSKEGYWYGFIDIDVFFQLETNPVYTQEVAHS